MVLSMLLFYATSSVTIHHEEQLPEQEDDDDLREDHRPFWMIKAQVMPVSERQPVRDKSQKRQVEHRHDLQPVTHLSGNVSMRAAENEQDQRHGVQRRE